MNRNRFIAALTAVCLLAGGSAFAKGHDRGDDRRDDRRDDQGHYDHGHDKPKHKPKWHKDDYKHNDERGAGPDHNFRRGGRLPVYYRTQYYVVDDWRGHRLSAPPRGYHWVQTGSDYVLVAIATGIILQIFLN